MTVIPQLIARYAGIWYAFCGLGAFFYVWHALQARRQEEIALFGKEREDAARQSWRSWVMAAVCVSVAVGVYTVSNFVAPDLELEQADETPAIALMFTATPSPTILPSPTPLQTPTRTPAPVPTVAPIATPLDRVPDTPVPPPTSDAAAAVTNAACTSAGTQIISPQNGDHLWGTIEIRGTANLPNFAFYKFEIQWPDGDEWVTLQSYEVPVAGGLLGYWDTTTLANQPGVYRLRLVVVDNTGNFPDPCAITVVIEPPTPGS